MKQSCNWCSRGAARVIRIIVPHFPARRSEEFAFPLICQRDSHLLIPYLALMKKMQNVGKKLSWLNFTLFTWLRKMLGKLFMFSLPELLVSKVIFLVKTLNSRIPGVLVNKDIGV